MVQVAVGHSRPEVQAPAAPAVRLSLPLLQLLPDSFLVLLCVMFVFLLVNRSLYMFMHGGNAGFCISENFENGMSIE